MRTTPNLLAAGMLLATLASGYGQPVIIAQPQNQTNIAGTTAMFTVGATGAPPLSYQWRSHSSVAIFTNIPFGTEATLMLTNVQPTIRRFSVVVTDAGGLSVASSPPVTLTVLVPPSVVADPVSQTVEVGDSVSFSLVAAGSAPLSYQWRFNEQSLAGQTTTNLEINNAQFTQAGNYAAVVTNIAGSITSQVATLAVLPPVFTKITNGGIVTNLGTGTACAWGDYDNDGFIDLMLTSAFDPVNNTAQKNILHHNNGDGTFTSIANTDVTSEARDWRGCSWMDYDNDGDLDLFLTSTDFYGFSSENELFRNDGASSFTKMTAAAVGTIVPGGGGSEGPVWADYDRDGFLDVFVVRYGADWLFHNNGDGTFAKVPNINGIPLDNNDSYRAVWGDYDNDGWPDLFLPIRTANNFPLVGNVLYHGLGEGTFTNLQTSTVVTNLGMWTGSSWGDYDNDGYLDLFVTSRSSSGLPNALYRNNGDGTFTKMTSNNVGSIVSDRVPTAYSFADGSWGDYDNDGFLDMFVLVFDGVAPFANYLYHNNGNGSFSRVLRGNLVHDAGTANINCAWGDYDNDGFLDLFVARGTDQQRATNLLYRNNGNSNAWIKIKLAGTISNRSAVGAKVRVRATIGGQTFWQMRELNTGDGFSASPLGAHFGVGDATHADTVRIEWPSGTVQELRNVDPRQFLTITEPPRLAALGNPAKGPFQMQLTCWPGFDFTIETSSNLNDWTTWTTVTTTNRLSRIDDPAGTTSSRRFYRAVHP